MNKSKGEKYMISDDEYSNLKTTKRRVHSDINVNPPIPVAVNNQSGNVNNLKVPIKRSLTKEGYKKSIGEEDNIRLTKKEEQYMRLTKVNEDHDRSLIKKVNTEFKINFRVSRIVDKLNSLKLYADDKKSANLIGQAFQNPPRFDNNLEIHFVFNVYDEGVRLNPGKDLVTKAFNWPIIDQEVLICIPFEKITISTVLVITIYKTSQDLLENYHSYENKNLENQIASTTISLYNIQNQPREGVYLLLLHKDKPPGIDYDSKTPGIVEEIQQHASDLTEKEQKWYEDNRIANKDIHDAVQMSLMEGYNSNMQNISLLRSNDFPHLKFYFSHFDQTKNSKSLYQIFTDQYHEQVVQKFNSSIPINLIQHQVPNVLERQVLDNFVKRPDCYKLVNIEKKLFWKFRYYMLDSPGSLPKFLLAVDDHPENYTEAIRMMNDWTKQSIEHPIFMLSRKFSLHTFLYEGEKQELSHETIDYRKQVRQFAVNRIEEIINEGQYKLELILLQLVCAVRYEFPMLQLQNISTDVLQSSLLVKFLIKYSVINEKIACVIYWYILVETDSEKMEISTLYKQLLETIVEHIKLKEIGYYNILKLQIEFRKNIHKLNEEVVAEAVQPDREAQLKKKLQCNDFFMNQIKKNSDFWIISPEYKANEQVIEKTKVFSSNASPFVLNFIDKNNIQNGLCRIVYKNKDDLRMDQLIMQIQTIFHNLLNNKKIDSNLTIYECLAYTKQDGLMQFVPSSCTLQDIMLDCGLEEFFLQNAYRKLNKEYVKISSCKRCCYQCKCCKSKKGLGDPQVETELTKMLENYRYSLAASCVITYLLGVGDRHLENIMLKDDGSIFHIDFGFTFDQDPNLPQAPPFKQTPDMIEPFGGTDGQTFKNFKGRAVMYYTYLRKHSKFMINLLLQLVDSQLTINPNKDIGFTIESVNNFAKKLRIDKDEKTAEKEFEHLFELAIDDLRARIQDGLHVCQVKCIKPILNCFTACKKKCCIPKN